MNRLAFNAISLVCCTALAIAFDKWWFIFLVLLFYIPSK